MKLIDIITDKPKQSMDLVLLTGDTFTLNLQYVDNQQGWFYTITSDFFNLYNRRMVTHPNMLRCLRSVIPFGLCCITEGKREPIFIDDFLKGRAQLYILEGEDILVAEEVLARND